MGVRILFVGEELTLLVLGMTNCAEMRSRSKLIYTCV